jgi:hypothetical protein
LIFRIRHCPTLPELFDPEDSLPWSSGSGIVSLFMECMILKMHCLDLQDQTLSHSFWTSWPWRCTALIFRIRHCPTFHGMRDPEDAGITLFQTSLSSYQSIRCNVPENLYFQVKLLFCIFWYLRFQLLDEETEES